MVVAFLLHSLAPLNGVLKTTEKILLQFSTLYLSKKLLQYCTKKLLLENDFLNYET